MSYTHHFDFHAFKGDVTVNTGLFIGGKFVEHGNRSYIDVVNPATGKVICQVTEGTAADVDLAVQAAQKAMDTTWGLNCPGTERAKLLNKLANLMEENIEQIAMLEALDNGKTFGWAKGTDCAFSIETFRHYAGWADKIQGKTLETTEGKFVYTRHEPIGVCGQIIPWNFPLLMLAWKLGPALATGCAVVLKPSEFTPLSALYMAGLIQRAGFPDGAVNIIVGYGNTVGEAITTHMGIQKIAFTGSTLVGRKIMEAAGKSNLKNVTLELGGKSPNIIFDDADLEQALNWTAHGLFWNHGQTCCAGTRIYVQEGIYDKFVAGLTAKAKAIKLGDPFAEGVDQGPQVSNVQYDRIMSYIESGKQDGATVVTGGGRFGDQGFFIEPTIFTDVKPEMKIVQEEIFGPVGVVVKFKDQADVIKQANDTMYGLAAAVFTKDITLALETAHKLQAGTAWVNCINSFNTIAPFGGCKQSGIGRELGEYALSNYTNVKTVHVNLNQKM